MKPGTFTMALVFATAIAVPALADRDPTAAERSRIEDFLRSEGFRDWGSIELDDEAWEVEGAMPQDSDEGYDLKLDPSTLEIIEREED